MAIGVAMALGVTTAVPATATAPPEPRSTTSPVDHTLVSEIVGESWAAAEALEQIGLTADDLVLPERDDDLYAQVAVGLQAWLAEQAGEQADGVAEVPVGARGTAASATRVGSEEDDLTRQRLAYALHIAEVNAKRDRRAGPIEREVVYMYLSHYVDTPRGTLPGLDAHSDYHQYYAAWISDDDRMVYDRFLATNATLEGGNALVDSAKALAGLRDVVSVVTRDGLRDLARVAENAYDVVDVLSGDLTDAMEAWTIYLGSTSDDPERVVRALVAGDLSGDKLEAKQRELALDVLRAVVVGAAFGGGPVAFLGAVALGVAEMTYLSVRSFTQRANYASMIASNHGRVAERMWRYLMGG
ncbi:hypothetical protein [Cellulomonas sp. IC4_254]|uniref:hypothetical protein n=1 Tax=Cellulomonas sp. IC4_254 TaxID=2714040 RepID=UPI001420BC6D|nr:hypothetical protein [Cellulomonas sp. IC4_254]NHT16919.1 hypothetical protein [Cellulomonas sp. IC4_254]